MTGTGIVQRKHPELNITYDLFQYYRKMTVNFQDADGNLVDSKFEDARLIEDLFEKGEINTVNPAELRKQAELGIMMEKYRKSSKTINFGVIYGMGAPRLADTLEIPLEEAEMYIAGYFDAYPGVKAWMAEQRKKMDEVMYTETMLGRKRRVYPEIEEGRSVKWKKYLIEKAYRMGINSIIQGSSSDMTKLSSIKLQPLLKELDSYIVLWIHDELLFDVPENIGMGNLRRIADVMANALPLDCGMTCDIEVGKKWNSKMSEDEINALALEEDDEYGDGI